MKVLAKILAYLKNRLEEILMLLGVPLLAIAFLGPDFSWRLIGIVALFLIATALILFHAYTFNDWANYKFDRENPDKQDQPLPARLITLGETMGLSLLAFLFGLGIYILFFPRLTLGLCLIILILWILYSNQLTLLKNVPVLSTLLHLIEGTLLFALGWSLFSAPAGKSWAIGLFFGLLYASGHLSHETIDYRGDMKSGLRTNAVAFGQKNTFQASFLGMTLSTAYICFLAGPVGICPRSVGIVFGLSYLIYCLFFWSARKEKMEYGSLKKFRSRYRKLYSLAGLAAFLLLVFLNHPGK